MSDSPEKCDEYFNNIHQLEDLGGDFGISEYRAARPKRSELETAFEQKRLQLEEARNRKATALVSSAERMLKSIEHKLGTFEDVNDINGYMAGDRMIDSIRERVEELQAGQGRRSGGYKVSSRAFTRRPYASSRISRSCMWMGRMSSSSENISLPSTHSLLIYHGAARQ